MKALVWTLLAIPIMYSCSGSEEQENDQSTTEPEDPVAQEVVEEVVENRYDIGTNVVGIFALGIQVPKLPEDLSLREFTRMDMDDEGNEAEHRHNMIYNQLEDCVELIMDQGSDEHHEDRVIEEMIVLSNYYTTDDSISVGSSIEELDYVYAQTKFYYSSIHDWYFCESPDMERVEFIIDSEMVKNKPKGTGHRVPMSINDFTEGAKVVKIRVH